jgi:hypothetical protein
MIGAHLSLIFCQIQFILREKAQQEHLANSFLAHLDLTTIMKIANLSFFPSDTCDISQLNQFAAMFFKHGHPFKRCC